MQSPKKTALYIRFNQLDALPIVLQFAKKERIRKRLYKTWRLARADIFAFIEPFITGPAATITVAASVRKPLNRPRREDRICLWFWGQSTVQA
ncbi:hypothetical protein ACS33_16215 [Edwardsiella ictaluri]|nr:hypothetical protein B6E78_00800 [Edwardsiella ictaluri]KMQ77149.1 hypothetical protein ABY58_16230 [Edwardsiella ictaluri]KOO54078.1 hypothetical protein ACS33_16215 [Edwardsiella ictaluri]